MENLEKYGFMGVILNYLSFINYQFKKIRKKLC